MKKNLAASLLLALIIFLPQMSFASEKIFNTFFSKKPAVIEIINADLIFTKVCNLYGISALSFSGSINVLNNRKELTQKYQEIIKVKLPSGSYAKSFYLMDKKTIYTSLEDYNENVIIHEVAHAVISAYFIISPTVQINEILSKYADYTLSKNK